jgi:hypothetical protein
MFTVNPELIALATARFEKSALVPGAAVDPAAAGGAPPMDPAAAVDPAAAAAPVDPAMAGGAPPMDPAAMGAAPPAMPPAPPAPAAPGAAPAAGMQQKLKPEQMMQMLDYRLYNMQQQLTAIMNAMGVQVPPESLVLPPGTTGAPPAETALPGGPMAPPPPEQAAGGMQPPGGPLPPGGPMPPNAPPADPNAKVAWWANENEEKSASSIGRPFGPSYATPNPNEPTAMQIKANALAAMIRSIADNAG